MHQVIVNKIILKNDCHQFLQQFHDTSINFFLLLMIYNKSKEKKRAFFKKGNTTNDYAVYLSKNNTRVLYNKAFEFKTTKEPLELSFVLIKSPIDQVTSLAKINKLITNKNPKIYYELFNCRLPIQILKHDNTIYFKNTILELNFSLKKV